ncbi:MAG: patatin-like phospholipase family protein [Bacteroidaceae bacterium]|nr:patatin-like phospholipase family protein [Bacteroidaceae bacterium]
MARIAISLSGGGFRAATFHLGALSYLNHLRTSDGKTLLNHVRAVSTISGGTLTGLWFILGQCRGLSNDENLRQLYHLLLEGDVIGRASLEFLCGKSTNHSLIREMVRIYDEDIFKGATMGDLMDNIERIDIDDFSANATEFSNATEFRFQVGKEQKTERGGSSQGIIGNAFYKIPHAIARQIRLAEVFAASSCFPGGFEALFFPRDFQFSKLAENADYMSQAKPIALMDGGVVDNQGIEPINLLRKRRDIDLFIISDAGRGQDQPYTFEETDALSWFTVRRCNLLLNLMVLFVAQFLLWVPRGFWFGFFLGLTILFVLIRLVSAIASRVYIKRRSKDVPFSFRWKGLLTISFSKYIDLIRSRATSMYTLSDKVFMKHIRTLNYNTIYLDEKWRNRRIMNALYELGTGQRWDKHLTKEERVLMEPSEAILANSDLATSMGTTLWWSDEDRRLGKPQALMAAGQHNMCWNLLEFIYRLRRDSTNLSPEAHIITELQETLEADWQRFRENPLWLTYNL